MPRSTGRSWIRAIRDNTLALGCLRFGLPSAYAKGVDRLPSQLTEPALEAFARSLDAAELARALEAAARLFVDELKRNDVAVAERLEKVLLERATSYSGLP